MSNQCISINGSIQSSESFDWLNDSGYKYGYGCFETMRCVNGKIPLFASHYERLMTGLNTLAIPYDEPGDHMCHWIQDLYNALDAPEKIMACRLYISGGAISLVPSFVSQPNTVITLSSMPPQLQTRGIELTPVIPNDYFRIKGMQYAHHIHALRRATNWPIYIDSKGLIMDASIFSVGLVTNHGIVMAKHPDQLPSISRDVLLRQRRVVDFRPIHQSEIESALGVVGCNAIMGVTLIDGGESADRIMTDQIGRCPIRFP